MLYLYTSIWERKSTYDMVAKDETMVVDGGVFETTLMMVCRVCISYTCLQDNIDVQAYKRRVDSEEERAQYRD